MAVCELCGGEGYWFEGDIAVKCPCQTERYTATRKTSCGITPHLQRQTFDKYDLCYYDDGKKNKAKIAFNAAKKLANDFINGEAKNGLLFMGTVGSGKTYLASAIANAVIDQRGTNREKDDVRFVVVPDLLDQIRSTYKDSSPKTEEEILSNIKSVPLLILDDLGTDNNSDFTVRVIFSIINYRLNYELPTIITTNLSRKQIEEVYGSRICSRLMEMCRLYPIESDKDIRLAAKHKVKV